MLVDQRIQGRRAVLKEIRKQGRIARVDVARETGISQATVTSITAELLREELIVEVPRDPGGPDLKRGRPRVDLQLNGNAYAVAGIKVTADSLSLVLIDYLGDQMAEDVHPLPAQAVTTEEMASELTAGLTRLATKAGITFDDISAVGIGLAGIVDAHSGHVHWSPNLVERNVPLRDTLTDRLGRPVFLDNDANLVAMAEMYFGYGRDVRDFLVVTVETGVGMGIVLDGELYRGTRGCGAEFGHTKVQLDGALCRCGQRGCLEAYVADYALLREAAIGGVPGDQRTATEQVRTLIEAGSSGDEMARTIIQRAGRMFAMGLANLVNIFDPQLIILSGERMQSDFLYADEVIASIRKSIVQVDADPPEVIIHRWGDLMWAMGAAAYALNGMDQIALEALAENAE